MSVSGFASARTVVRNDTGLWICADGTVTFVRRRDIESYEFTIGQLLAGRLFNFGEEYGRRRHSVHLYVDYLTKAFHFQTQIEDEHGYCFDRDSWEAATAPEFVKQVLPDATFVG